MVEFKVGLEIHGYIKTAQKLFCNCSLTPATPNTHICPVCTGQPGSKPKATNKEALKKALKIGLMLGCTINPTLLFQRKHYSWPDSPNNYQRTMSGSYASPVGENGEFEGIRIEQVHLEEDPARWDPKTGAVDYNRAGSPLIEIVTKPDFTSAEQVREWLQKLVTTLSYIDAIQKDAGIKSDVNISIAPLYERVEIKNVNSQSAIVESILYEVERQSKEKELGNAIPMQTRTWDGDACETKFMRSKETAADYMFIPDPDIPTITVTGIESLRDTLPEPPSVKEQKLIAQGVTADDAHTLSLEYTLIDLFESLHDIPIPIRITYLRREVVRVANYNKKDVSDLVFDTTQIHTLLSLVAQKKITDNVAKKILNDLLLTPFDVLTYVKEKGLLQVSDARTLETMCQEVITEQQKAVDDYKSGNQNSLNFLVGQVMRKTKGAAAPDVVLAKMKELLD